MPGDGPFMVSLGLGGKVVNETVVRWLFGALALLGVVLVIAVLRALGVWPIAAWSRSDWLALGVLVVGLALLISPFALWLRTFFARSAADIRSIHKDLSDVTLSEERLKLRTEIL